MPKATTKSKGRKAVTSSSAAAAAAAAPYTLPPISTALANSHPSLAAVAVAAPHPYLPHAATATAQSSGVSLPPIIPPTSSTSPTEGAGGGTGAPTPIHKRITKHNEDPLPWLEIKLDGEDQGSIPVYDSCNEVRRKIRAFFSNNSGIKCTQKRFLEAIGNVNCNSYRRFMSMKGEGSGAENGTFYGAYVFFEKKRIYDKKPKGKKRLESEHDYPKGRPLSDDARHRWQWVGPGITPLSQKEIRMSVAKYGY